MIADVMKTGIYTMRVVIMITLNFWAEVAGQDHGLFISEWIIWVVSAFVVALARVLGYPC
ncbi:hypothetical protein [Thalassospira sp. TSL5-1]|uniref:hypothetical protein n=1 Tax=Thalassospira sp. TSL5-1 TaxID=1544451 RepID=UPI00093A740F|nr:hypothetical protein [Thalassospira sp. TSL5-1]OKH87065.1 hypothetical protein LF95_18905 [Thalassospira sp. TSL5-1]